MSTSKIYERSVSRPFISFHLCSCDDRFPVESQCYTSSCIQIHFWHRCGHNLRCSFHMDWHLRKKKWLFKVMIQIRTIAFSIVLRERRFSHVETVMFSEEELINRWKAGLWNKMYLNSILKGSFLCVKTFQPITTVVNKDNKSFQFSNVPHIGLLRYLDSEEILVRGK